MADRFENLSYLEGFGNELKSEARDYAGALPRGQLNPQKCNFNLVAEQLSGSAFTAPRSSNRRSWLYRMRPSVCHKPFKPAERPNHFNCEHGSTHPNQTRWHPFEPTRSGLDFVDGIHTLAYSNADGSSPSSVAVHIYLADKQMDRRSFVNNDGDFLIVPQEGTLDITTEFGLMRVEPNEIAVVPQGMKFSVNFSGERAAKSTCRGYILEVKGNHFELPQLGPIGANCLANPGDFQTPTAHLENKSDLLCEWKLVMKFENKLFEGGQDHSPYDVAAWSGNYYPYKYNLDRFVCVNTVSVDHPDPSIFTVLTCPSIGKPGTALADFVIFPPRWECAKDTFRPPYFHRNCMTEFMGLIKGQYQAKSASFAPGGGSLHQAMMPHGPDEDCFRKASEQDTSQPKRVADETMAFMFETSLTLKLTRWGYEQNLDRDYHKCWEALGKLNMES